MKISTYTIELSNLTNKQRKQTKLILRVFIDGI